jgi:hypothetical protein
MRSRSQQSSTYIYVHIRTDMYVHNTSLYSNILKCKYTYENELNIFSLYIIQLYIHTAYTEGGNPQLESGIPQYCGLRKQL